MFKTEFSILQDFFLKMDLSSFVFVLLRFISAYAATFSPVLLLFCFVDKVIKILKKEI